MAFIGKEPLTGAYNMLDNLTASATASYSLTLDSTAFVPESANHLLVSLNGVIQKAGSSYTVSGSTLTFSSSLASSDSIDFVLALGNVLDIGTPSDATVTNAKTNFVSTSSAAGLQIKGDGTTDGTLQLNCSQNSHGIKLKSPAHSTSSSYTLTFPGTDPSADKFLKTDGSGNLSFADASGEDNSPYFLTTGNGSQSLASGTMVTVAYNTLVDSLDSASGFNTSNYRYTIQSGGAGFWSFTAAVYFTGIGDGTQFDINFYKNGGNKTQSRQKSGGSMNGTIQVTQLIKMDVGDYMEVKVFQNTGSTQAVTVNDNSSFFGGFRIKAI